MSAKLVALILLFLTSAAVARDDASCEQLSERGHQSGIRVPGYLATYEVVGDGRLQFYSAPDRGCKITGVFVVPRDRLTAYVEYKGYTAVLYIGGKNGEEPMGWVLSSRLRATGTGISPKQ